MPRRKPSADVHVDFGLRLAVRARDPRQAYVRLTKLLKAAAVAYPGFQWSWETDDEALVFSVGGVGAGRPIPTQPLYEAAQRRRKRTA